MNTTCYLKEIIARISRFMLRNMQVIPGILFFFLIPAFPVFSQGVDDEKDIATDSIEVLSVDFFKDWKLYP